MKTLPSYVQIYKTTFFLPVKSSELSESISEKIDGMTLPLDQLVASGIDYCKSEFGPIKDLIVPKQFFFYNMRDIKNDKKIIIKKLIYIPFIENDKAFLMISFLSTYQAKSVPHTIRYVYPIKETDGLKFCGSYQEACLFLLSYFEILQKQKEK